MSELENQLEECGVCHSLHPMEELGHVMNPDLSRLSGGRHHHLRLVRQAYVPE